jgi:hypothetical protein
MMTMFGKTEKSFGWRNYKTKTLVINL